MYKNRPSAATANAKPSNDWKFKKKITWELYGFNQENSNISVSREQNEISPHDMIMFNDISNTKQMSLTAAMHT